MAERRYEEDALASELRVPVVIAVVYLVWGYSAGAHSQGGGELSKQLLRNLAVQLHPFRQLRFVYVLARSMRDVDRSRPNQQRLAPVRERGDVRGKSCDHRRQVRNRLQAHERNLETKLGSRQSLHRLADLTSQFFGWSHQAVKKLRLRVIWNHVRRASTFDQSNIKSAGA